MEEEQIDFSKLKYVLYARKSTTDETRQVRSIQDQITDCTEYARRNSLNIVETLTETKSAKEPKNRPVFTQMLKDIKIGKYDGILSWHPDRLARNMLEGGILIDMIDSKTIKDLKFVTHNFTNDPVGKMMLGVSFVMSKQYSDDLSQKVTRGVRKSHKEGKSPTPKHGYLRNESGQYVPDEDTFPIVKQAWQMRLDGHPLEEIADWMNREGYKRQVKRSGKLVRMDKRILSKVFRDTFYYGDFVQANQTTNLRELYDFEPAVSEQDFYVINERTFKTSFALRRKRVVPYPFKRMILCSFCGRVMRVGASSGHGGRFLYLRCGTDGCPRKGKSVRSKVILDFIYQLLEEGLQFTDREYQEYYQEVTEQAEQIREEIQIELHRKRGLLSRLNHDIRERSLVIGAGGMSPTVKAENEKKVNEMAEEREVLEQDIEVLQKKLGNPEEERLTIEEFLNLSKNAAKIVKAGDAIVKDTICRYIFLNLKTDGTKVLSYQAKEPFATLLKRRQVRTSRGSQN